LNPVAAENRLNEETQENYMFESEIEIEPQFKHRPGNRSKSDENDKNQKADFKAATQSSAAHDLYLNLKTREGHVECKVQNRNVGAVVGVNGVARASRWNQQKMKQFLAIFLALAVVHACFLYAFATI
jgi:hypothetical protein